jgi:hypothetical protein
LIVCRESFEIEGKAQFLRAQGAGAQAHAELLEQAVQQKGQRFEQDDGVLEFDGFLKYQRFFHRNQSAGRRATSQLLQAQAFLSEALDERNFRQRGQGAQVANSPAVEGFEQAVRLFLFFFFELIREQNCDGQ